MLISRTLGLPSLITLTPKELSKQIRYSCNAIEIVPGTHVQSCRIQLSHADGNFSHSAITPLFRSFQFVKKAQHSRKQKEHT